MDAERASRGRRRDLDPADVGAQVALLQARARTEGSEVLLFPLADAGLWDASPAAVQELAAREVARRLGASWRLLRLRRWSCEGREGPRLATLEHGPTGVELQLLPAMPLVDPQPCELCADSQEPGWSPWGAGPCPRCRGAREVERSVSEPFLIGRWPVTVGQWYRGRGEAAGAGGGETSRPKANISLGGARAWCERLGLRLPEVEEWCAAAGAGVGTRWFWGEDFDEAYAWGSRQVHDAQPVERHEAAERWSAYGLVDVVGNVAEWVAADGEMWAGAGPVDDPEPGWGLALGGSFESDLGRAPWRAFRVTDGRRGHPGVGLRVAATVPEE